MRANRAVDSQPELRLRQELHRQGLRYRKHRAPLSGLRCRADVVFPRERVAVFVDGCFWHGCPDHGKAPRTNSHYWGAKIAANVERDRRNNALLQEAGWSVVRIWEHDDLAGAAREIRELVKSRCPSAG